MAMKRDQDLTILHGFSVLLKPRNQYNNCCFVSLKMVAVNTVAVSTLSGVPDILPGCLILISDGGVSVEAAVDFTQCHD